MSQYSPSLQYSTSLTSQTDSSRRGQYGLEVLSEGKGPVTVDIVAVHGLGGHRIRTWTHKSQCYWLGDLLPVDIPDARIMTFGYDANVRGSSLNTFKDSARLLLHHLLLKRDPGTIPSSRPILFICHSLGGIVAKQALVKACSSPEYRVIRGSIIGTIFMGTPHRGSSVASLGKVVADIARLFSFSISMSHLRSLLPNSQELSELSSEFCQNIMSPPVKVVNFFESKRTKVGLMRIPIVPQASAVMDPVGPIQEGISLDGDHRQICQFANGDDTQYQLVLGNIRGILAPETGPLPGRVDTPNNIDNNKTDVESILAWLQYRSTPLLQPVEGTCQWAFDSLPMKELRGGSGHKMLWIHGSPGVGKSFLSSYIASRLRTESDTIVIYSTFNAHTPGSRKEAALVSVILGQLLAEPRFKDDVFSSLVSLSREYVSAAQIPFRKALQILVKACHNCRRCYLVLDGLDEMTESTTEKTNLLRALVDVQYEEDYSHPFKAIVTSRDMTPFREILSCDLSLQIKPKDTADDVMKLARLELHKLALPKSMTDLVSDTIRQRSHGLFIWASLFVSGLQTQLSDNNDIKTYIAETKEGLDSLYAHTILQLHRTSPGLLEIRKLVLTFCSMAAMPLELSEICNASDIELNCHIESLDTIYKACGPLIEITDGRVSLSHLSIRDYILAGRRQDDISLPESSTAAHTTMANICLKYLCLDDHQQPFSCFPWYDNHENGQYPLLRYASLNWGRHMAQAGPLDLTSLEVLRSFIASNAGIRWATSYYPLFQHQRGESLPSAFAELQSLFLQIKSGVLKSGSINTHCSSTRAEICQVLDTFFVQSFETVLAVERSITGTKSRGTIERLLDLSRVLRIFGSPKQARLTAREASSIAIARFGSLDPLSLICTHHALLLELNNMPRTANTESKESMIQDLRDLSFSMRKVLGQYHQDTLRCRHDLGLALFRDQQVSDSYFVLRKVYEDMKKHLGQSKLTQRTANNLANALYTLKRLNEAESLLLSIEDIKQLSQDTVSIELDSYHIYSFESLELLANVYLQQTQTSKAVLMHERAIAGRALLGGYDAELFLWVTNLGAILVWQEEFAKASSLYVFWISNGLKNIQLSSSVTMLRKHLIECLEKWKIASEKGLCEAPVYDAKIAAAIDTALGTDPVVFPFSPSSSFLCWSKRSTNSIPALLFFLSFISIVLYMFWTHWPHGLVTFY
ncbi:hypothetical protein PENCOP_c014G06499, partial [Penicillium coprophilum]